MSSSPSSSLYVPRVKSENGSSLSSKTTEIDVSRKRARPRFSCDACHDRKVKCDGGSPCGFCMKHKQDCVHSEANAPKRRKLESSVTRARPATEEALFVSHIRQYYHYLFVEKINPVCNVFQSTVFFNAVEDRPSQSQIFEESAALAHTARALGHLTVADQYYQQARHIAGELIDDFYPSTAVAYVLLMMYTMGHANDLAMHYAAIAQSIADQSSQDARTWNVSALLASTRVSDGLQRRSFGARADKTDLLEAPWYIHENTHALDIMRRFPKHSALLDVFCSLKIPQRYPVEQRSDEYPLLADVESALSQFQFRKNMIDVPWKACQYLLHTAIPVFLCTAARLVEPACFYCRRILTTLHTIPSAQAGFSFKQILVSISMAAQFVAMYRIHSVDEAQDYRLYLRELYDILLPLASSFPSCASVSQCLANLIADDGRLNPVRYYTALPMYEQLSILKRWARDCPHVRDLDRFFAVPPHNDAESAQTAVTPLQVENDSAFINESDAMLPDWLLAGGKRNPQCTTVKEHG